MFKNTIISSVLFLISLYFWFINIPSFNFKGTHIKTNLEGAFSNFPFILEVSLFLLGIILSIIFFAFFNYILSTNLRYLSKKKLSLAFCTFFSWVLSVSLLLGITSYLYPELFFSHEAWKSKGYLLTCSTIAFILLSSSLWMKVNRLNLVVFITPFVISYLIPTINIESNQKTKTINKNVFIIGVDSLNVNLIGTEYTPYISKFIGSATFLPNSYTHIARTFPSWMTILTGDYPLTNKARLNLTDFELLNTKKSLPYFLKQAGYNNYFSLDERRFSHIDNRLFFDRTIGPPATAGEFVFSKLLDIPLLVITSDLVVFKFFMPQIHNNRAAWQTYSPTKYNEKLKKSIDINKSPIFLASHFTLPHWPYKSSHNKSNSKSLYEKYLEAVKLADNQVEDLIYFLRINGLLENAILFIISDHGESFGRKEDMPSKAQNLVNIAGHGTSIVSKTQFNVLMSFKEYKNGQEILHSDVDPSLNYALSDITPTILDMLKLNITTTFDGKSIFNINTQRPLPIESSLKPMFNKKGNIDISGTVTQNAKLFEISESGELVLKKRLYPKIIKEKQHGVIYQNWQLSIYPELDNSIFITDLKMNKLYNYASFANLKLKRDLISNLCILYSYEITQSNVVPCLNTTNNLEAK